MESETKDCPACSSSKVRKYRYGLIRFKTDEDMEKSKEKYVLAGCIVREDSPAFHCDSCGKDFGNYKESRKEQAIH